MAIDAAAVTFGGDSCPRRERAQIIAGQLFKLPQGIRDASHDLSERQIHILAEIDSAHTAGGGYARMERKRRFAPARPVMEGRGKFVVHHCRHV
ncbi:hypothetical protein SAMN04488093_109125 [Tropicibacter naphthalenivorans]|uniref:Uncharacterized protein n=1 Tax=Tropicibacter naphthalenivorans TaxID=441103 RepID=A0A0P1GIW1_9RHOB|nr:hypothetical protein TRN7648_03465 [Tropicibacter naphthalenivorans]SMD00462.1 hypothetical protein SAMN04488093_109125 [Tropicibacter naphthalenivorans]